MKFSTHIQIKITLLVIYIIMTVTFESLYRDTLFTHSLEWERTFQKNIGQGIEFFFKFITRFGTAYGVIPLMIVVFLFFPITKSYTFLSVMIFSSWLNSLLKMIYGSPRPFWVSNDLFKICDGGYGNPSGHSFSSIAIYLSFWHLITDHSYFKTSFGGKVVKVILLLFFICLITLIVLSRIFLGVHSVNQVIYGLMLGFSVYMFYFHVIPFYSFSGRMFFEMITNLKYLLLFSLKFATLLLLSLLLYFSINRYNSQWESVLKKKCSEVNEYRRFNNDALFGCLTLFNIIGGHFGVIFLASFCRARFPGKENEINHWSTGTLRCFFFKTLLSLVFLLPMSLAVLVPKTSSLLIIFLFKVSAPYLIGMCCLFGPCISTCIMTGIANPEIYGTISCEDGVQGKTEDLESAFAEENTLQR